MAQATRGILIRMAIDEAAALDKAIKKVEIRIGRKVTLTEAIRTLVSKAVADERAMARAWR